MTSFLNLEPSAPMSLGKEEGSFVLSKTAVDDLEAVSCDENLTIWPRLVVAVSGSSDVFRM